MFCYGSVVYGDLSAERHRKKLYGRMVMQVTMGSVWKTAFEVLEDFTEVHGVGGRV